MNGACRRRLPSRLRQAAAGVLIGLTLLLTLWHLAPPASAQASSLDQKRRVEFVLGNVEFLFLHELAHFIIDEKQIPIIGPEENAADYLAALALIRTTPFQPGEENQTIRFLLAAADAFTVSWSIGSALGAQIPYWGAHALNIQRYYQIACLIYGSNPKAFESLPTRSGLPRDRADSCVSEYARANEALDWLLKSFGRQPGDPPSAKIDVLYEQPKSMLATRMLVEIQNARLLEQTVERMLDRFTIEQPMSVVMRNCDQSEAAWLPETRELVVCYELIDTIYLLSLPEQADQLRPLIP